MAYCKFRADQLFTGYELLDNNHVLITDEDGIIIDIIPVTHAGDDIHEFSGILAPGFINSHCHLELSHMRDKIPSGTGLPGFISSVMKSPAIEQSIIDEQMRIADEEMYTNGIAGVGDICNHPYSLKTKINSQLLWYNFLEITNLDDSKANTRIDQYKKMEDEFYRLLESNHTALSPHAIYSVSPQTFQLINEDTANKTITIHNQECAAEDELLKTGNGKFIQFFEGIGRTVLPIKISGKSSIQTWLPYFNNRQTIISVHNTYISEEDIVFAKNYAAANALKLVFCFCPNANLYIENTLPPIDVFIKHNCTIVLGTDSYASNWQLSITNEIAAVHQLMPHIAAKDLLQWATINGAAALGLEDDLGSFDKGKKPGIILLRNDFTAVKRIL